MSKEVIYIITILSIIGTCLGLISWQMYLVLKRVGDQVRINYSHWEDLEQNIHILLHDAQQIKHRLTTIKRTTKKDLKQEKPVIVHTKPRKYRK